MFSLFDSPLSIKIKKQRVSEILAMDWLCATYFYVRTWYFYLSIVFLPCTEECKIQSRSF